MTTATAYESWTDSELVCVRNSRGKLVGTGDVGELLKFLRYSASQTIRVAWSLDDLVSPILRLLPRNVLDRLSEFDDHLEYQGHELYYLPQRLFRVGKSRFYGIRDFWGGLTDEHPTLENVQESADELLATLAEIGLPNPRKLTSPPAIFEDSEWGKRVYSELPKGHDLPESCYEMLEYASKADGKDWVSNHYVGHFDRGAIFDYDISACYPSIAAKLPDLRELTCWKSRTIGKREEQARLGIVRGRFTLDPSAEYAHCSPIIGMVGDLHGNPLGKLPEDYYTLNEVRFVLNNGLGEFKMRDGWFADGRTSTFPMRSIMEELYNKRSVSQLANTVTKGIANSIIGKLIETKVSGEYGPLRNDLYHASITAQARIEVARFLVANQVKPDELCCVQTDGVKLTRDIPLKTNGMGHWVNKGSVPTILFSPYKVYAADARPYRLTYADVTGMIKSHPNSQRYEKTINHRVTLVQAIRQYEDITKVGELIDLPDSLDMITLEQEQNRCYKKLPRHGQALLNGIYPSTPFVYE